MAFVKLKGEVTPKAIIEQTQARNATVTKKVALLALAGKLKVTGATAARRITLAALLLALVMLPVHALAQDVKIEVDNAVGFKIHEGNEETIGSKIDDPAKVRLTAPMTEHGGGGGVLSFNFSREIGKVQFGGNQIEMGMLRVEQAEDVRGQISNPRAEFNFLLNAGGTDDAAMQKPLAFTVDHITRISPGILADLRSLIGGGTAGGSRMMSPKHQWWLQLQDDGNYVIYDAFVFDDNGNQTPKPVFDLWWLLSALEQLGHPYPR